MNALWRLAYSIAARLIRLYRRTTGNRPPGAFVAVWCGRRILLLKPSYQVRYAFPGGILRWREDARLGAVREVAEETGIALPADALRLVTDSPRQAEILRGKITLYETELAAEISPRVDHREILWAGFVDPDDPRAANIWPPYRDYIAAHAEIVVARE
jgi:8-oxo-dGTP diphosphatase